MIFINHIEVLDGIAAVVEIEGPLDSETSPDFEDYINQLLRKELSYIMLDAGKLEYVSSEGIGVILFIQKKLVENRGFLVLYNIPDDIMSLYKILGFDKIFTIASSRIDAMQIMDRQIELRKEPEKTEPDISENMEDEKSFDKFAEETTKDNEESRITGEIDETALTDQFQPLIVECVKCKTLIRVKKKGDYMCPECNTEFSVDEDQTVNFVNNHI